MKHKQYAKPTIRSCLRMPKCPNIITWQDAEYVALQLGFVFRNHHGTRHRQYKKDGVGNLTIGTYSEISTKAQIPFGFMLRQMGITKKKFFEILKEKV